MRTRFTTSRPTFSTCGIFCFVFNIRHGWGAVDFRICLALKYHGYSLSAQRYEFCPHLAQIDNLDLTMPLESV